MTHVTMNALETRTHQTFTALMWALSHPGRIQTLPTVERGAFFAIAEALLDPETSYYASHAELDRQLARLGARSRSPELALYQFYPTLRDADLADLRYAPVGTRAYPDEAATLVIGCTLGTGTRLCLNGPGIPDTVALLVDGIPTDFWPLREVTMRYPLGWDVFLVHNNQVVGLPRTTMVEVG